VQCLSTRHIRSPIPPLELHNVYDLRRKYLISFGRIRSGIKHTFRIEKSEKKNRIIITEIKDVDKWSSSQ
jgi:hypothetical protein